MSLYVLDTNTATYAYVVPLLSFVKTSSMTPAFFVFDNVLIKRVDKSVVFMDIDSYAKASMAVEQALALNVDCLVTMDDYVCNLVIECLNEKNINIPSDIRLASLYDSKQLAHNNPPITSLHFNTKTLGENACGTLLEMLGEKLDEDMSDINYQVVLRDSTK
mgnify:CR=1 FL=1